MLSDTHPDAEKVQIELLRKATFAQRWAKMASLTAYAINLSRRAIAEANPGLDQRELDLKFVELSYGRELADRLRTHLEGR
jgi:hypothetical protein